MSQEENWRQKNPNNFYSAEVEWNLDSDTEYERFLLWNWEINSNIEDPPDQANLH